MRDLHNHVPTRKTEFPSYEQALRAALAWVRARHDSGAISPAVFSVIRMIETELAWCLHRAGGDGTEAIFPLDATPSNRRASR